MTDPDVRKLAVGLLLFAVSTALVLGPGTVAPSLPVALAAVGTLGLAAAALLVGTADAGRPV